MASDTYSKARIESDLKRDAERVFAELGLTTSQAIKLFLKRVVRERGIPFELKLPNEATKKVIEEARRGENVERFDPRELG